MQRATSDLAAMIDLAIQNAMTKSEYEEMRRRNSTAEYRLSDLCASHDFCDSNHYACAAFERLFNREPNLSDERDIQTISDALDIAHRVYWTPQVI